MGIVAPLIKYLFMLNLSYINFHFELYDFLMLISVSNFNSNIHHFCDVVVNFGSILLLM